MSVVDRLVRRPRLWAAVAILVTLAAVPFLTRLGVDNSIEAWIDREGEDFAAYQEFLDSFGSEEYVLVLYRLPPEIDLPFLEKLTDLRFALEEIPGVRRIRDLAGVYSRGFGMLGIEAFRDELQASPFYRDFLISGDGRLAATWIELDGREQRDRSAMVEAIEAAIAETPPSGEVHLAGSPVIDRALDQGSRRAARTFFPLVFLLSGILLLFFFPQPYGVLIPFLSVGAGIVWILTLMALCGCPLNMVTVTLPPLLWVLGLSTSIHLLSRCRQLLTGGAGLDEAISRTMSELGRPCLLSSITTALGFGSLMISSMRPVREMGQFASLGILLCLASNFLLFPWLARVFPPKPGTADSQRHPVLHALDIFVDRRHRGILAVSGVLALALAAALSGLRADSNVIGFFKRDSPIAVTYQRVLAGFTGPYSVEVLLTPPGEAASLQVFHRLDVLSQSFGSWLGVAKVVSAADLVKKAHQRAEQEPPSVHRLPVDEQAFEIAWQDASSQLGDELEGFYDADKGTLRLSVLARPMSGAEHRQLVAAIRARLDELGEGWRPRLTGIVTLLVDMQERLLESQIKSFALAVFLIGPVIALLLRSARYAALSLVPNLMPIATALGIMALFEIALDPATVMIAGIALGIGVDDTIHLLECYLSHRRAGESARQALDISLQTVGRAMVRTSVVATLGFFVLCFSEFLPLLYFGLFTAIALVAALVAALVVLPALLTFAEPSKAGGMLS
ncbi:MAG: MMPL family transporter [bacterium]|nr:MMPL family transporter [bacterium]